jgi:carbamoyl-phosphate synthase large subunit
MFKVLITSVGRRVELVKAFRTAYAGQNVSAEILAVDASPGLAPAGYFVDKIIKVPKVSEANYLEALLELCSTESVNLLIPLFEPEFDLIAVATSQFESLKTKVVLSNKQVLSICGDKWQTYKYFRDLGVKTPYSYTADDLPEQLQFPVFVKPRRGMASIGACKVVNQQQLLEQTNQSSSMLVQQYIAGTEFTIDALTDFSGRVLSIVPRERLEVRSGEVSKGRTVDRPDLIEQAVYIVDKLGAIGPLTLQCIDTGTDVYWIEINPRFGGGVPLSIAAGVDYPMLLYRMWKGDKIDPFLGQYRRGLTMLRYDEALYIPE